jgi:hypothetical protein
MRGDPGAVVHDAAGRVRAFGRFQNVIDNLSVCSLDRVFQPVLAVVPDLHLNLRLRDLLCRAGRKIH